jgi:hypothetical protein
LLRTRQLLSVDGYQALDGSNHVNGTSIVFKDEKKIVTSGCFTAEPHCYTPGDGKGIREAEDTAHSLARVTSGLLPLAACP